MKRYLLVLTSMGGIRRVHQAAGHSPLSHRPLALPIIFGLLAFLILTPAALWGQNAIQQFQFFPPTQGGTAKLDGPIAGRTSIGGAGHTCALVSGGTVSCWGFNLQGQLGDGSTIGKRSAVFVSGLTNAVSIATAGSYSCALISDGTVKCWGYNGDGQLGDGTTTNSPTPVSVSGFSNVVAITTGNHHACALIAGGTVRCWGDNDMRQLGDGTMTDSLTPVAASGIDNAIAIAAGSWHSCALLSDSTAKCWGFNGAGQAGDGTTGNFKDTPVSVVGLTGAVALTAGETHTCALLSDSTAKCWGRNFNGELGTGTATLEPPYAIPIPVAVLGISNAVGIATGGRHSCALLSDSTAKCWGSNVAGQLGDGTTADKSSPTTVTGLTNAVALATGLLHTCALLSDGTARCWGFNGHGQLGDGTTTNSPLPVAVLHHNYLISSDLSLTVSPTSGTVSPGGSTSTTVTDDLRVTGFASFPSVSGLPSGATASFSPTFCVVPCSLAMTISTSFLTPLGTFPITISSLVGGITRTTIFTLTVVGDTTPPTAPTLLSPADGSTVPTGTVQLDWSDGTDPSGVTYTVQVDNNADFSSAEFTATGLTSSAVATALEQGVYHWRVRAVDGAGNVGAFSAVFIFGLPDADDDGILDAVDVTPSTVMTCATSSPFTCTNGEFNDISLGGNTFGQVKNKEPGVSLIIADQTPNPDKGVRVIARGSGNTTLNVPGGLVVDGTDVSANYVFSAPADFVATRKSSVLLEVTSGTVVVVFAETSAVVEAGESLLVAEQSLTEVALTAVAGTVAVTVGGQSVELNPGQSLRTLEIDIKPGSFPNSINLRSKGLLPVAILSSPTFDGSTVIPETIVFGDPELEGRVIPVRTQLEDVNGDGLNDMVAFFDMAEIRAVGALNNDSQKAGLTAKTTNSEIIIAGSDPVRIVPAGGQ